MKIENGKLIYEETVCWDCNGTLKVTRHTLCPNWGKPVNKFPNRECPDCKSNNKHSHQTVGSYIIECQTCNATGKIMENAYTHISQDQWNVLQSNFKFSVVRMNRGATFNESYLGLGALYGCTDYGRITAKTDEEILKIVPTDGHPCQPVGWMKKGELPKELIILVRNDGYSVIGKFE